MASKTRAKKASSTFSDEERAAMREYVREKKGAAAGDGGDESREVLAKIATMPAPDRVIRRRSCDWNKQTT